MSVAPTKLTIDELPDTPEEAWSFIERFANAAIQPSWVRIIADLDAIQLLKPAEELLPNEHTNIKLVAILQRLLIHVEQFNGSCDTVRHMIRAHKRSFPNWAGPQEVDR